MHDFVRYFFVFSEYNFSFIYQKGVNIFHVWNSIIVCTIKYYRIYRIKNYKYNQLFTIDLTTCKKNLYSIVFYSVALYVMFYFELSQFFQVFCWYYNVTVATEQ